MNASHIDVTKTVERVIRLLPDRESFIQQHLPDMIWRVLATDIAPGDFYYTATGGMHVQRVHYIDDGLDEIEVFVNATVYDWDED